MPALTLDDLVANGTMSRAIATTLRRAVEAHRSYLVIALPRLAGKSTVGKAMLAFARKAVSQLKPVTQLTGRPMRSAGFVVLKAPDVPSILLELGYLSSRADAKLLTSDKWQGQVAAALAKAQRSKEPHTWAFVR